MTGSVNQELLLQNEYLAAESRAKVKKMMERRLDKTRLYALLIDATPFRGSKW